MLAKICMKGGKNLALIIVSWNEFKPNEYTSPKREGGGSVQAPKWSRLWKDVHWRNSKKAVLNNIVILLDVDAPYTYGLSDKVQEKWTQDFIINMIIIQKWHVSFLLISTYIYFREFVYQSMHVILVIITNRSWE